MHRRDSKMFEFDIRADYLQSWTRTVIVYFYLNSLQLIFIEIL